MPNGNTRDTYKRLHNLFRIELIFFEATTPNINALIIDNE